MVAEREHDIGDELHRTLRWLAARDHLRARYQLDCPLVLVTVVLDPADECRVRFENSCKACKKKKCKKCGLCKGCGSGGTGQGGQGGKGNQGQLAGQRQKKSGPPGDTKPGDTPAEDSKFPSGKPGEKNLRDVDEAGKEIWGQINDREVARSLRELWGKIPVAYRGLVAQYFLDITDLTPESSK